MAHHITDGVAAVRELHLETVDVEDAARPDLVLGEGAFGEAGVARIVIAEYEIALHGRSGQVVLTHAVAVIGEGGNGVLDVINGVAEVLTCGLGNLDRAGFPVQGGVLICVGHRSSRVRSSRP